MPIKPPRLMWNSVPRKFAIGTVAAMAIVLGVVPVVSAGDEVPLTREILKTGQKLLAKLPGLPLVKINVQFKSIIEFGGSDPATLRDLEQRLREVEDRKKAEPNAELRDVLEVVKQQVEIDKKQLETQDALLALGRERFSYDTESVMRRPLYRFPDDNLVVVVADFSSGNPDEGREIADEIAVHLSDLVEKARIACHILVGEVKPGLIIRSEQMARDVGASLPVNTDYVVIWGTMSPRTVGKYRPHITCCWKQGEKSGVGAGLDLPIETSELPLGRDPEERSREAFRRLIGVTCATIPSIFAAHEINRERTPDLIGYYDYLGADSEEAKCLKAEVEPLTQWTDQRSEWRSRTLSENRGLRRASSISVEQPYPKFIFNEIDGSVLALIVDAGGEPVRFDVATGATRGKCICYMDTMEVSNQQFLAFLNSKDREGGHGENREVAGTQWIDVSTDFADIAAVDGSLVMRPRNAVFVRNPVIGVSWYGARDYCKWAGKELPTQKEWELAAARERSPRFPWGDSAQKPEDPLGRWNTTAPCGLNGEDRSRNGCLDMRGNVREWCADVVSDNAECAVKGGSFEDKSPEKFDIKASRKLPQVSHGRDVGFRGVIRLPVPN